jgi:hypothetical protein
MHGDEGFFATVLMISAVWNLLSFLFPVAVILVFVWYLKKANRQMTQLSAFTPGIMEMQRLLQIMAQSQGNIPAGQRTQFNNLFLNAQNDLNQLDNFRRQQSELRLADMRSQAASLGIFVD